MSHVPCLLMTGGTGFVGRYLAPLLVPRFPDHNRVMLVRPGARASQPGWKLLAVDLTDEAGLDAVVAQLRPNIVVHLAAQSSVGQARDAAEATWSVNVICTFNLARAVARHAQTDLVFFSSTGEVYGSSCRWGSVNELTPAAPTNAYALSKLAAERILQDVLPPQTRLVVTRAFNHSGAGHDERFVLPSFAGQIARAEHGRGPPVISVGNLEAERDFLHVRDVVSAYIRLIEVSDKLPLRTLLNVASGTPWKLQTLLDQLLTKARVPIEAVRDVARMRASDISRVSGDSLRLRQITGWDPQFTVENILDDLLEYFREQILDSQLREANASESPFPRL